MAVKVTCWLLKGVSATVTGTIVSDLTDKMPIESVWRGNELAGGSTEVQFTGNT